MSVIPQVDHDHCNPNPCQNDAPCFNTQADYYCHCSEDWEGKNCSFPRYKCDNPPCDGKFPRFLLSFCLLFLNDSDEPRKEVE